MTYTRLAIALGVLAYGLCIFLAAIGFKPMLGFVVTIPVLVFLVGAGNYMRGPRSRGGEDEEA